jgi:hypothetical protein
MSIALETQSSIINTLFALSAPTDLIVGNSKSVTGPAPTPDGSSSGSTAKPDPDTKKDDKAASAADVAAKKDEPAKKMYCN